MHNLTTSDKIVITSGQPGLPSYLLGEKLPVAEVYHMRGKTHVRVRDPARYQGEETEPCRRPYPHAPYVITERNYRVVEGG
jgi:3-mercaptopyruvate sulfurtransferase SseA